MKQAWSGVCGVQTGERYGEKQSHWSPSIMIANLWQVERKRLNGIEGHLRVILDLDIPDKVRLSAHPKPSRIQSYQARSRMPNLNTPPYVT